MEKMERGQRVKVCAIIRPVRSAGKLPYSAEHVCFSADFSLNCRQVWLAGEAEIFSKLPFYR